MEEKYDESEAYRQQTLNSISYAFHIGEVSFHSAEGNPYPKDSKQWKAWELGYAKEYERFYEE